MRCARGRAQALARLIDALPPERRDQVFTHTSWAPDRASSYERLEFLGDSVLELAIARALYDRFPDASEGRLAKIRAHVVSRQSCAAVARDARPRRACSSRARRTSRGPELAPHLAEPQRARGAARGGDRGRLPRARLRRRRARDRGGVRRADRVREHRPRRLQDGAPGGAGADGTQRPVRRARRRRAAARASVRLRGADRRRAARRRAAARRRRPPSRRQRPQALAALGVHPSWT